MGLQAAPGDPAALWVPRLRPATAVLTYPTHARHTLLPALLATAGPRQLRRQLLGGERMPASQPRGTGGGRRPRWQRPSGRRGWCTVAAPQARGPLLAGCSVCGTAAVLAQRAARWEVLGRPLGPGACKGTSGVQQHVWALGHEGVRGPTDCGAYV